MVQTEPKSTIYFFLLVCMQTNSVDATLFEPCHEKTSFLHMQKHMRKLALRVTAKLISAFVFASQIIQSLLLPKSEISSL